MKRLSQTTLRIFLIISGLTAVATAASDAIYDLNKSRVIDAPDLLLAIDSMKHDSQRANFNGDSKTDWKDLFLLASKWGTEVGYNVPDPKDVAPPIDDTEPDDIFEDTDFIYDSTDPIQIDIDPEIIEPTRVAVLRGRVFDRSDGPLPGVEITILNHSEFGRTFSREDGWFDMAVNGGGLLTVSYSKEGYLPVHRKVQVPWRDFLVLNDVCMTSLDPKVTVIDLADGASTQVAEGSEMVDDAGVRTARVLFPAGTEASMVYPDAATQPISLLSVHVTEYTVGEDGPEAMPAELPPNSGYTYCVEISVEEAISSGADNVQFSDPVYFYLDNFLSAEVGSTVPMGYYDRNRAVWVPSDNGRVIEILDISAGLASLDVSGSGVAATPEVLAALGITEEERQQLAQLHQPGASLWRVPILHFTTPWDANWAFGPPEDAEYPDQPPPRKRRPSRDCERFLSSSIGCRTQTLEEDVPVVGTPFQLHYLSDRVQGHYADSVLNIPLSATPVPDSLIRIELEIHVAGRLFTHSLSRDHECLQLPPCLGPVTVATKTTSRTTPLSQSDELANQSYTLVWDGKDAYGRTLQGSHPAKVRIGYVYCGAYRNTERFGYNGGGMITGSRTRQEVVLWQEWDLGINLWRARALGLGGWSLSVHHTYDPDSRVLYRGDGIRRSAEVMSPVIETIAGTGTRGYSGDGGPATAAQLIAPWDCDVGPDGSLYIADLWNGCIRRVDPDGIITTVAGNGTLGYSGDGGWAKHAQLDRPSRVTVAPDGSLYIADTWNDVIRRVGPDGIITTVVGTGEPGYSGDGGPAIEAQLFYPYGVAIGPDGNLYVTDERNARIRRVGADGTITTVAGTGQTGYAGEGGLAIETPLDGPAGIAFGPDGSLFVSTSSRVMRVTPDGIIATVAGDGTFGYNGDGGPATDAQFGRVADVAVAPDGSLYIVDEYFCLVRRVGPDGIISTVAGDGTNRPGSADGPATGSSLNFTSGILLGPDGSLYIAERNNERVRRVAPALPQYSFGELVIPSEDGREVYIFTRSGRHQHTLDALTGQVTYRFTYDNSGLLVAVTDIGGSTTVVERERNGDPITIISPSGQRTELGLDANGYLESITNPAWETVHFAYSDDGLLESRTDVRGAIYRYSYDNLGRLIRAEDPAGGFKELTRTDLSAFDFEVVLETALGRRTTYSVEDPQTGEMRLVTSSCCGTQSEAVFRTDDSLEVTTSDGTTLIIENGPDPRFGMLTPVIFTASIQTPKGSAQASITKTRSAHLADKNDPLSLTQYTDTVEINGKTFIGTYQSASRTFTETTAEGRQRTLTFDAQGRLIEEQSAGLAPVSYGYDDSGRLATVSQDNESAMRSFNISYDSNGYVASVADSFGILAFVHDAAGRVESVTLPGGAVVEFDFDANGNLSSLTPPGRSPHRFKYTPVNLEQEYAPPQVGHASCATFYTYNPDRQRTGISSPDGRTIDLEYDEGGRLSRVTLPSGQVHYSYESATGRIASVAASDGGVLRYQYDGFLLLSQEWTGNVTGSVEFTYNNDFLLASQCVDSATPVLFAYDNDALLTQAGDLTLKRSALNGLLVSSTIGEVTDTVDYNAFSDVLSYSVAVGGSEIFAQYYSYDARGRITEKVEFINGATETLNYRYDPSGRLNEVRKRGVVVSTYAYDSNGNRLEYFAPGGIINGTYDDQDRLIQYGDRAYAYTASGHLSAVTEAGQTTTFAYDALGNLIGVTLPDGTQIDYIIDGANRRIGKKVNGLLVQGFLYRDSLKPIAELDGNGKLVSQFVYASRATVPDYMIRSGNTYRLISDHLGSPRIVVNVATGEIVQRMDYDEFGNVLSDSNPRFQPFGFAGGLYESDAGLVRFGLRDYDAYTGRWTAKDPIRFAGSDLNLYGYALSDPVNVFDPTGLIINCEALFELIAFEKLYGKYLTSMAYSGDKAIPLNDNYPSIYGPVDIDWMMRVSMGGLAGVPGIGRGISWTSYFAGKTFWNTIRALGDAYELEYDSLFELGNYNSWRIAAKWLQNGDLTLEEIFKPSIDYCNCMYGR